MSYAVEKKIRWVGHSCLTPEDQLFTAEQAVYDAGQTGMSDPPAVELRNS
jgi:hypothetical protein